MTASDRPERDAGHGRPAADLDELQRRFAAHIRDPDRQPAPDGIEDRRLQVYRDLFFNNIRSMLAGNFPVLRALYGPDDWSRLVRDFYADYRCHTPLFTEIAREFLRYLQEVRRPRSEDPPFLLELAHYEWVELALELDEREPEVVPAQPDGDLLDGAPVLSPLAWPLSYRFPVHRIRPDYRPAEPPAEPTHLLVYRDRQEKVRFMELNAVARLLIAHLQDRPGASGRDVLQTIAADIGHPDPARVEAAGADLLADLRDRGVILGTKNET
jgi:hypothetical protein